MESKWRMGSWIESGIPMPEANKGGRPKMKELEERDERIIQRILKGEEILIAIDEEVPDRISEENRRGYIKDLKKRILSIMNLKRIIIE
ncbi:MAG: hypothetical protein EOP52_13180 [Sphingobacteriales bacterium]|nr:MAG: hypothetical protein EOP52_13180 [Sphingobacteriales bacterium]